MAVYLAPIAGVAAQFFDNNGNPLSGGKLYTYQAGTTTPAVTYTTNAGVSAHTNPIVLDSGGRIPNGGEVWLSDNISYKLILKTSDDVTVATWDNIDGINSNFLTYSLQQEIQTATDGQTVFNLSTITYQPATGTLSVYVDGLNQYGPSATYSYVETDSTTVTFNDGLHEGALVKFTTAINNTGNAVDASAVTYTPAGTGAVTTNVQTKLRETVSVKDFGAVGDGIADDGPAIRAAIAATAGTGNALDFGNATYLINSTETKLSWETFAPAIRLPDSELTIIGSGFTLQSGTSGAFLCMIQTTIGSSAKIKVSGGTVKGTGDTGGSTYALIDGIVLNKNTSNVEIDMQVDNTKRHGFYVIDGANHNIVKSTKISNTNREMLGCGVQIEGASDNYVQVDTMYQIGSNGLDINEWTAGGYYPVAGGYTATNSSSANKVFINSIDGTGINNNPTGSFNGDDDYYGLNLIGATTVNNYVEVGEIKSVRTSNGTISPHLSTYAAAVRLGGGISGTTVIVGNVSIVGPSNAGALIKPDLSYDCFVQISTGSYYTNAILTPVSNSYGNKFIVQDIQGSITTESFRGLDFKFLQASTCTTVLDGVVSGWAGDYGLTFQQLSSPSRFSISVNTSTFKKIYKQLVFTYPYVTVNFDYFCNNIAGSNPTIGLDEVPYANLQLTKDSQWHSTSIIIPYTDGSQTFAVSPNNSGTAASGQYIEIKNITITLPDGTTLGDNETTGLLVGYPTTGTYTVNQRVQNYTPAVGQPKAWVCTVAGTSGTWVSEGNL